MRKSVKIIIAIVSVMICLLVILSMTLSGTVAKYVSPSVDCSDSARVAKWGVTIDTYSDLVSSYTKDNVIVFQASGGTQDKIIAPGTRGSLIGFEVKGKAEVSYAVDIVDESVSFSFGDGYNASSKLLVDEDNEEFYQSKRVLSYAREVADELVRKFFTLEKKGQIDEDTLRKISSWVHKFNMELAPAKFNATAAQSYKISSSDAAKIRETVNDFISTLRNYTDIFTKYNVDEKALFDQLLAAETKKFKESRLSKTPRTY